MEELSYEALRRIQTKEKGPSLVEMPDNFYELAAALLTKCRAEQNFREYENVLKILRYIHSRRQEKVVTAAINHLRGIEPSGSMITQERTLYEQTSEMLRSDEDRFNKTVSTGNTMPGNVSVKAEKQASMAEQNATAVIAKAEEPKIDKRLLIRKDIDEFVGLDGKAYGPFKSGEVIDLPEEEADMLIKMKAAEWKEQK